MCRGVRQEGLIACGGQYNMSHATTASQPSGQHRQSCTPPPSSDCAPRISSVAKSAVQQNVHIGAYPIAQDAHIGGMHPLHSSSLCCGGFPSTSHRHPNSRTHKCNTSAIGIGTRTSTGLNFAAAVPVSPIPMPAQPTHRCDVRVIATRRAEFSRSQRALFTVVQIVHACASPAQL